MYILKRIILAALIAAVAVCARSVPLPRSAPIVSVPETTVETPAPTQVTSPTQQTQPTEPEPKTLALLDFLRTAVEPVGSTMYVWGGGWNEADTGAGIETVTLGLSQQWAVFAAQQDSSYNYKNTRYQIHDGLDCSGYVGWAVYNTLETASGGEGYVYPSTETAEKLAQRGLGEYIPAQSVTQWLPGDIMSMKGHVWIAVGMCGDGSVLLLHASPPGVIFCGTKLPDGETSQAVELAERIMAEHYPGWYERYPNCARSYSYLEKSSAMRWSILSDEEGLRSMGAEQIAELIFAEE